MAGLRILETRRMLQLAQGGRLQPWLGPALRGLTGGRLRARVCRRSVADQVGCWTHCVGCPLMAGCAYGETYEPDPPAEIHLASGWENTARPLVVAPIFPVPENGQAGLLVPVRTTFIGATAARHANQFWEALRIGGADGALGLGAQNILFDLLPDPHGADTESLVELPRSAVERPEWLPWVRVELTAPLFLTRHEQGKRRSPITKPSFGDLLRAGLRVLGPLHKLYGEALPDELFGRVKSAALSVPTISTTFSRFAQWKMSHRTGDHFKPDGCVGSGTYGPVPGWLVPWLRWAGRVHVGTHRIAGAGGWKVVVPGE